MNNFKSGSGDLDFGDNDEDEEENRETELEDDQSDPTPTEEQSPDTQPIKGSDAGTTNVNASTEAHSSEPDFERNESDRSGKNNFPYFVRRNNVGDERDKRLELHVREQVVEDEAKFRNELADILDTSEISKTDAREFALLAAFQQPEEVAQLMQQEGFGAVD